MVSSVRCSADPRTMLAVERYSIDQLYDIFSDDLKQKCRPGLYELTGNMNRACCALGGRGQRMTRISLVRLVELVSTIPLQILSMLRMF